MTGAFRGALYSDAVGLVPGTWPRSMHWKTPLVTLRSPGSLGIRPAPGGVSINVYSDPHGIWPRLLTDFAEEPPL